MNADILKLWDKVTKAYPKAKAEVRVAPGGYHMLLWAGDEVVGFRYGFDHVYGAADFKDIKEVMEGVEVLDENGEAQTVKGKGAGRPSPKNGRGGRRKSASSN